MNGGEMVSSEPPTVYLDDGTPVKPRLVGHDYVGRVGDDFVGYEGEDSQQSLYFEAVDDAR